MAQQPAQANSHARKLAARGNQPVAAGLWLNGALAAVKVAAGLAGDSFALIADGLESSADVFSSIIVFLGLRLSAKPADENHPYGHGKAEPMAAAVVGLALVAAGLAIAVQAIREILTPHPMPKAYTLWVLAGVVAVKETMFRYGSGVGAEIHSTAVKADAWHHRSDAITSAFAFLGIAIALWMGPGWETADDWAALAAAPIILFNAYRQLRPALQELSDAAPPAAIEQQVRAIAASVPGVRALEKCFVRKMGFEFLIDLHVEVDPELSVREGHRIAHNVQDALLAANPRITQALIHIEPHGGGQQP
jgi:cation diffusion facilitator family transporter